MTERECIYILNRMETIGPAAYRNLIGWFGTAEEAWSAGRVPLSDRQCEEWDQWHRTDRQESMRRELEDLPKRGIRFLCRGEEDFPTALREIPDPPIGLFLKGKLPKPGAALAAMVGARYCSEYGKTTALELGKRLAEEGVGVVSGMAMGIDSWSQRGTLEQGGYSLAVLGSGIDICYPPSGRRLYARLEEQGGILSEYGPGEAALPFHFPLRNRLISGLSRVVLVIEARERSGSLITVDYALEQGREVLAVPGRIGDPLSQGCNQLIRQGAGILTGISDVLMALGKTWARAEEAERKQGDLLLGLPEKERRVYDAIVSEPVHQDILAAQTGVFLSDLYPVLWELETRGLIRQCGPGSYIRVSAGS